MFYKDILLYGIIFKSYFMGCGQGQFVSFLSNFSVISSQPERTEREKCQPCRPFRAVFAQPIYALTGRVIFAPSLTPFLCIYHHAREKDLNFHAKGYVLLYPLQSFYNIINLRRPRFLCVGRSIFVIFTSTVNGNTII